MELIARVLGRTRALSLPMRKWVLQRQVWERRHKQQRSEISPLVLFLWPHHYLTSLAPLATQKLCLSPDPNTDCSTDGSALRSAIGLIHSSGASRMHLVDAAQPWSSREEQRDPPSMWAGRQLKGDEQRKPRQRNAPHSVVLQRLRHSATRNDWDAMISVGFFSLTPIFLLGAVRS